MTRVAQLSNAVVDASAIVDFLLHTGGAKVLARLFKNQDVELHVPSLCDIEVAAAIRRAFMRGRVETVAEARSILDDLGNLPLERYEHGPLLQRTFDLRDNFSTYDASYVALAEALGISLLTADAPLAAATNAHTDVVAHLIVEN